MVSYRVYYAQRANRVVLLLCGGDRSTQQNDITKAHQLAAEWHATEDDLDH
jgi:putative addiction module killer protein